jgi:hypothetical protein
MRRLETGPPVGGLLLPKRLARRIQRSRNPGRIEIRNGVHFVILATIGPESFLHHMVRILGDLRLLRASLPNGLTRRPPLFNITSRLRR